MLTFIFLLVPGSAWAFETSVETDGSVLNVRSGPATDKDVVGEVGNRTAVSVVCQVWGEQVSGTHGSSPFWNRIGDGRYVSDAFLSWGAEKPQIPWCGREPAGAVGATVSASLLNIRSGPGTGNPVIGQVANATVLAVRCQSWGTYVEGDSQTSVWAQVGEGRYVTDAYVAWSPERPWLPWCGQEATTVAPGTAAGFIAAAVPSAQESQRVWRVPASVTLAQAILESGWGRSTLTREDHNYFGMKCFGDPGTIALGCRSYATHECNSSGCYATSAIFRAYRNATDSYVDHGRQLATLPRYATAMSHVDDPDLFAHEIHQAGYATSPTYADKLIGLMRQYDLYQYDLRP